MCPWEQFAGKLNHVVSTPPASQDECRDRLSIQSDFLNSKEKTNFIFNAGTGVNTASQLQALTAGGGYWLHYKFQAF